jgi:hypothetical protein
MQRPRAGGKDAQRHADEWQHVIDRCIGDSREQEGKNANAGVRPFGNASPDPLQPPGMFKVAAPDSHDRETRDHLNQNGQGYERHTRAGTETNPRGNVKQTDGKSKKRKHEQQQKRDAAVKARGSLVHGFDIDSTVYDD